jgi:hypothetical protein
VVCLMVGAAFARGADPTFLSARYAQAKLGPEIWSEVVQIENTAHLSRYPASLHALVFEVAGILWIYTDGQGTESLSLRVGELAAEKADLSPLLRAIEPGFVRWKIVSTDRLAPVRGGKLRNGCFIESLAALRERRERGEVVANARLLSYYYYPGSGRPGHTVLAYATDRGMEIVDPQAVNQTRQFSPTLADNALTLAQALAGASVARARWIAVDRPTGDGIFSAGGVGGGEFGDTTVLMW